MPFGNASTSAPTLPRNQGQGGQNQMQHVDGSYGGALHNQQQQQQAMQYNGVNAPAPASSMMMPQTGQSFLSFTCVITATVVYLMARPSSASPCDFSNGHPLTYISHVNRLADLAID
jgi:hypothetical protein